MKRRDQICLSAAILSGLVASAPDARGDPARAATQPQAAGWIEEAWIGDPAAQMAAKLDTGAATSSLHAEDVTRRGAGGEERVTFTFIDRNGERRTFEAPIVRWTRIRRAGADPDERPVVRLALCLAGVTALTEFTLADRSGLDYPLLVGRSFLAGRVVVDSATMHAADGMCAAGRGK